MRLNILHQSLVYPARRFGVIRFPFLWERLQPVLGLPVTFDPLYLSLIDQFVANVTGQGMQIVLDPHNYARYRGDVIGAPDQPVSDTFFGEFWAALATRYMANPLVVFGIMNEVRGSGAGGCCGRSVRPFLPTAAQLDADGAVGV